MKILISNDSPAAHFYIRMGLAKAFNTCGHTVVMWDIHKKPVNDAFDELEPDLFISQTYNINRITANAIKERPHLKVIMKGSEWSKFSDGIDPNIYPVLKANQNEVNQILKLYQETGKPDYIYVHYHPDYIEQTHERWIQNGIKVYSQLSAADIFEFTNALSLPEFASDITFVGGYWPYKAKILNEYLIPLCKIDKYRIKIFGNSQWPTPNYCGMISDDIIKHALFSATVCPNLHEPHSQVFGYDVIERPFKLLANKCFVISDYVEGLAKIFNNEEIQYITHPKHFADLIDHYIEHPKERLPYIERGYNKVINEHTYFHRIKEIFERLHFENESQNVTNVYNDIKAKLKL